MDFRKEIADKLLDNRPKLTASSLRTYTSLLFNLCRKLEGEQHLSFFKNDEKILKHVEEIQSEQSKKTLLSALFVLTEHEQYREVMLKSMKTVNDTYATQTMTKKQSENRLTFEQIKEKYADLKKILKTSPNIINYQNVLLLGLMSGIFESCPPRRNEWASVKIKGDINLDHDNYFKKNVFVFNKYKTVAKYGKQMVHIPIPLLSIYKKYEKMNTSDFMFYNPSTGKEMNTSELAKRLKSIFDGRAIGCDALRSIFLSDRYKDVPALQEMEDTAQMMGHNIDTAISRYVKK